MRSRQDAVLDALQRAERFLDESSASITGADFTAARKRLDDVVTTFTSHALGQDVEERGQAFIASANGMADAATIHKDTLVAHGMPSTFLDALRAGVAKLETSFSDRENSRTKRIGATKGLTVEEKHGETVLSVLDALVQQSLAATTTRCCGSGRPCGSFVEPLRTAAALRRRPRARRLRRRRRLR